MRRVIAVIVALAVGAGAIGAHAAPAKRKTSSTAYASIVKQVGNQLIVVGYFTDRVLGQGTILYRVQARSTQQQGTVKITVPKVTIFTVKGTLTGSASATATINADGTQTITDGKARFTKGTGAYAGHSLVATLTGSYANNVYTFKSTGTYS